MISNQWGKKRAPPLLAIRPLNGPFKRKALLGWEMEIKHIGSIWS